MGGDGIHFPDHFWGEQGAGAAPTTPTLSVATSGTTATATITGDAEVTNYLVYKLASATDWTAGGNRSGDGTIVVAGLSTGARYQFMAYSVDAVGNSLPAVAEVLIAASTTSVMDGVLADQASAFLVAFGESVTYYPKGGGSRGILAIIDRDEPQSIPGSPHGNMQPADAIVANSADDGISSSEFNSGGDKLGFPVRIGETPSSKRIAKIMWQDAGMMGLKVG